MKKCTLKGRQRAAGILKCPARWLRRNNHLKKNAPAKVPTAATTFVPTVKPASRQRRSKSTSDTPAARFRPASQPANNGTIFETPENWTIYRKPDLNDRTFAELCDSISESGINTPLEISSDGSSRAGIAGSSAPKNAALPKFPVSLTAPSSWATCVAERVTLVDERNKGIRIKSDGELYLEAAAAVDPDEAVRKARREKAQVLNKVKTCGLCEVQTAGSIARTDPSGERADMLKAVLEILAGNCGATNFCQRAGAASITSCWQKTSALQIVKNGYIYGTRPGSSSLLSKLLTDARSAGLINHGRP